MINIDISDLKKASENLAEFINSNSASQRVFYAERMCSLNDLQKDIQQLINDCQQTNYPIEQLRQRIAACKSTLITTINNTTDYALAKMLDNLFIALGEKPDNPDVMNFLFEGSCLSSKNPRSAATVTAGFDNVIFLDGVGSGRPGQPTPGTFNPEFATKPLKRWFFKNKLTDKIAKLLGHYLGVGATDNITYAMTTLARLEAAGRLPKKINLISYSYGGAQGQTLAHKIQLKYGSKISVNIFSIESVAPFEKSSFTKTVIPSNVENFVSIFSLNGDDWQFDPQEKERLVVADANKTKHILLPLPGDHCDIGYTPKGAKRHVSQELVELLLWFFLKNNGSLPNKSNLAKLTSAPNLTRENFFNNFDESSFTDEALFTKFDAAFRLFLNLKASTYCNRVARNHHKYVEFPEFFLNVVHQALFAQFFPTIYQLCFSRTKIPLDQVRLQSLIKNELDKMLKIAPNTLDFLGTKIIAQQSQEPVSANVRLINLLAQQFHKNLSAITPMEIISHLTDNLTNPHFQGLVIAAPSDNKPVVPLLHAFFGKISPAPTTKINANALDKKGIAKSRADFAKRAPLKNNFPFFQQHSPATQRRKAAETKFSAMIKQPSKVNPVDPSKPQTNFAQQAASKSKMPFFQHSPAYYQTTESNNPRKPIHRIRNIMGSNAA